MIPSIYDSSEVTVRSQWGHYNSATWPVPHRIFHDAQSIQLLGHPHDLGKLPKWQLWILMDGYSPKYMPIISWNGYEAMSYGWFIHVYSMLFPKDMPKIWKFTTGWWFQPLWKIWVSCDYDIPNIWKVIIQPCSSHHQPAIYCERTFRNHVTTAAPPQLPIDKKNSWEIMPSLLKSTCQDVSWLTAWGFCYGLCVMINLYGLYDSYLPSGDVYILHHVFKYRYGSHGQ